MRYAGTRVMFGRCYPAPVRVIGAFLVATRVAAAEPVCDHAEIDRMDRWHFSWAITYGALSAGQLGLVAAKWNPLAPYDRDFRDTLLVGAAESGLGAVAMLLAPRLDCDRAK